MLATLVPNAAALAQGRPSSISVSEKFSRWDGYRHGFANNSPKHAAKDPFKPHIRELTSQGWPIGS